MSDTEFLRRKTLLGKRLIEQAKAYNNKQLKQNINLGLFICVFLPGVAAGILFILNTIMGYSVDAAAPSAIVNIKNNIFHFLTTNALFHVSLIVAVICIITALTIHHNLTKAVFNEKDLALASYILAKTHHSGIINYQNLHKEVEFRAFSYNEFDKIISQLEKLQHLRIQQGETREQNVIIRISDW